MREDDYYKIFSDYKEKIFKDILIDKNKIYKDIYDIDILKIKNDAWDDDDDWTWKKRTKITPPNPSTEEVLEGMSIEEIEKFLRKKKLERITKSSSE